VLKKSFWLILGILALLIVAVGAYFWTAGLMGSMFEYRSPLKDNPPAPGEPFDYAQGAPLTHKVVFVLIDALREDTSRKTGVMPFLNELRSQGAQATMHSRPPSFSNPAWTALLTGAWPDINDGQLLNPPDISHVRTFTQDDVFAAADRIGLKAAVSGYSWFEQMLVKSGVDAGFYTPGEDNAADREVVDAALPWLTQDYQLVLIHIDQVDYAGHHEGGPLDPRWDAAANRSDELLREIVTNLDPSQDTIIVLSDHGQIDRGGHGGQDPLTLIEPFVMVGAGVKPGSYPDIQMVDVAPTVAVLLGANIPASNQGHVLTNMLNLSDVQLAAIHDAVAYQQIQLEQTYIPAIGERATKVLVEPGQDVVDTYQQAMDKSRADCLFRERTWRGLAALLLAAIPADVVFLKRGRKIAWLLAGALLYVLLFNLRYAVLDGRTYSLSSLVSQADIILFCAITSAIALLIAWLLTMLGLKAFRLSARAASETTLSFVLTTIYLLALPILWSYTLNDAVPTWTLPDAPGMLYIFLGFISLIQSLMVAVIGLLLTGIATLTAWLVGKQT
jgi:hypothetical protein